MIRITMETNEYNEGKILIVVPSGKLDTVNAPKFSKNLEVLLIQKPKACLLDFSQVSFLSSSGLQSLLGAAKISKKEEIGFAVFNMQKMIAEVFIMSGFNQFIQSFESKEDALAFVQ